ncbi:hypothetical protein [Streptomyces griseoluteus]|uniref:hypothetical protein n=1 Tax=Streptomyces griseoluteus TaxID=29306 RepID=UPI0036E763E0
MIEADAAVRIVEEELEREFQRQSALGVRPPNVVVASELVAPADPVMAVRTIRTA